MAKIHVDSDKVREAVNSIRESIAEVDDLAQGISNTLRDNQGAYGEGDADAQSMQQTADEIHDIVDDNSEALKASLDTLVEFADSLDKIQ